MCRVVTCVLLLMSGTVAGASAQQSPGAVYVKGGVSLPYQLAKRTSSPPPFDAPAGATGSWLLGGGVFLARALSAEFEVSRTGVMTSRQTGRHNTSESGWRQERFVSFGVKIHFAAGPWLRLEPTAGLVRIRTNEAASSTVAAQQRPEWFPAMWHSGVMVGADLRIGGRHVALVPGLRVYQSTKPDATRWDYNYPRMTVRPSLAIAAGF